MQCWIYLVPGIEEENKDRGTAHLLMVMRIRFIHQVLIFHSFVISVMSCQKGRELCLVNSNRE